MRQRVETAMTGILVVCALSITALAFRHEFGGRRAPVAKVPHTFPETFANWKSFQSVGRTFGSANPRVTITEFVDYECPACKTFSGELEAVVTKLGQKHPGQVSLVFVHFPLPGHKFAKLAGQAVECADPHGAFRQMQTSLFAKQDSFGLKPWTEYAREAGITDIPKFESCLQDSASTLKVHAGLALARKLELPATPTILIDGSRYVGIPTREDLIDAIETVLKGNPMSDQKKRG